VGAVSAAPLGNAAVLPISWMYVRMMGADGLRERHRGGHPVGQLRGRAPGRPHYDIHFSGGAGLKGGGVAHECILDLRPLKDSTGIGAEDVAKRLIDYGFHAPDAELPGGRHADGRAHRERAAAELDRFCDAMIAIRGEIARVENAASGRATTTR
jgi:glycine dehydrogenase